MPRLLANWNSQERCRSLAQLLGFNLLLFLVCCFSGCATEPREPQKNWEPITHAAPKRSARTVVSIRNPPENKFLKAYDTAFVATIEKKWYDLLDHAPISPRTGNVVLQFKLMPDGSISDVNVIKNTAGDAAALICWRAILDPAPYPSWPEEMRNKFKTNSRQISFTFYYDDRVPEKSQSED